MALGLQSHTSSPTALDSWASLAVSDRVCTDVFGPNGMDNADWHRLRRYIRVEKPVCFICLEFCCRCLILMFSPSFIGQMNCLFYCIVLKLKFVCSVLLYFYYFRDQMYDCNIVCTIILLVLWISLPIFNAEESGLKTILCLTGSQLSALLKKSISKYINFWQLLSLFKSYKETSCWTMNVLSKGFLIFYKVIQ